jgi:hypothetical protein
MRAKKKGREKSAFVTFAQLPDIRVSYWRNRRRTLVVGVFQRVFDGRMTLADQRAAGRSRAWIGTRIAPLLLSAQRLQARLPRCQPQGVAV